MTKSEWSRAETSATGKFRESFLSQTENWSNLQTDSAMIEAAMKHAGEKALLDLADLLGELRKQVGLKEKKPGIFYL